MPTYVPLLDRLRRYPTGAARSKNQQTIDADYIERIRTDISDLLNSVRLDWQEYQLNVDSFPIRSKSEYPDIAASVLNYGMPNFADLSFAQLREVDWEHLIKEVLIRFEPRIIARTLYVKAAFDQDKPLKLGVRMQFKVVRPSTRSSSMPLSIFSEINLAREDASFKVSDPLSTM